MPVLAAAVVVLAALVILNLLLTGAIIRRMRRETNMLQEMLKPGGLAPGTAVPEFAAVDQNGNPLSRTDLAGRHTAFAFFSATCEPCLTEAPQWTERTRELASSGWDVVTVVRRTPGSERSLLWSLLPEHGRVIADDDPAPVHTAFNFSGNPAYTLVGPDGTVVRAGRQLEDLDLEHDIAAPAGH